MQTRFETLVITALILLTGMTPRLLADERLETLIKNVEAAESLFNNIDVRYTTSSFAGKDDAVRSRSSYIETTTSLHDVRQGVMFRHTRDQSQRYPNGKVDRQIIQSEYDGLTTRYDGGNKRAQIHVGMSANYAEFHPYRLLYHGYPSSIPLTNYLHGYDQLAMEPRVETRRGQLVEIPAVKEFAVVQHDGDVQLNGLQCEKVTLIGNNQKTGDPENRLEFWFAKDRNWLPIRSLKTWFPYSQTVPAAEGVAEDLREIEPGVWVPFQTRYTRWNTNVLRAEGKQIPGWINELKVESLSHKPDHPVEFFRELKFADGTWVYEYAGGKKVRAYIVGEPEEAAEPSATPWYSRIPWKKVIPGFAAAAVILHAIWAGRRKRSNVTPC